MIMMRSRAVKISLSSSSLSPRHFVRILSSASVNSTSGGSSSSSSSPKSYSFVSTATLAGVSLAAGYAWGRLSVSDHPQQERVLPSGLPRTCCDEETTLTDIQKELPNKLSKIVGSSNVMDGSKLDSVTTQFLKGARLGQGSALCIVTPNTLQECVDCVQAIVDANCTVLPQGSNTGLTGGSVPRSDNRRPSVVISMKKLDTIFPIDDGCRVVCLAGAGLATLSNSVKEWFPDRESHSILGSTFLNPTTAAGVAFGSGGTQLRKGSAYTDRAMYITVDQNKWGENVVKVVNTLGEFLMRFPYMYAYGTVQPMMSQVSTFMLLLL